MADKISKNKVALRMVANTDLPIFFEHQRQPEANRMAAFPSRDWQAFEKHWNTILADPTVVVRTILFEDKVVGNIVSWELEEERNVGYWIDQAFWGRGIATKALTQFLIVVKYRPLYARVARHNLASQRVLEKCGFKESGEEAGFPDEQGQPMIEVIMRLEDDPAFVASQGG